MLDQYLTVEDLAGQFHCCEETIKRMARRGDLPGFKFGRRWFFPKSQLAELLRRLSSARHLRRDKKKEE
jgi:excisionase family DNA binding protein